MVLKPDGEIEACEPAVDPAGLFITLLCVIGVIALLAAVGAATYIRYLTVDATERAWRHEQRSVCTDVYAGTFEYTESPGLVYCWHEFRDGKRQLIFMKVWDIPGLLD